MLYPAELWALRFSDSLTWGWIVPMGRFEFVASLPMGAMGNAVKSFGPGKHGLVRLTAWASPRASC
ncbi:hypothetical protein, partial [Rubripirellula obstinata]|uniref:hypothetical protein n=1 Tax=Rubripirellula obstinata TaxID=406547 RepID=UPI001EE45288